MKRDFDDIMDGLKTTIAGYDYFVDFKKVYDNVSEVLIPLNLLNSLIGRKDDFDKEFLNLIHKYPESLRAIPILLAVRSPSYRMNVVDNALVSFDFKEIVNTDEEYLKFMDKTGLKELFVENHIKSLVDYVTGVEVGLDSNARKNRSGTNMEGIVENYLKSLPGVEFIPQAEKKVIISQFGYPELEEINLKEGKNQAEKRFDFALKYKNEVFLIETNFYGGGGSKLNEVARSYEKLADDINKLPHYKFLWITDGIGWRSARKNLQESYTHQQLMMTIKDLEQGKLLQEIEEYTNSVKEK
jgi:type II restriction enzyme